jgi:hypothetical protein
LHENQGVGSICVRFGGSHIQYSKRGAFIITGSIYNYIGLFFGGPTINPTKLVKSLS